MPRSPPGSGTAGWPRRSHTGPPWGPPNPGGWLATTARCKAIDRLRRARAGKAKLALLTSPEDRGSTDPDDDLLGLVFACCHPALPRGSQVALTLRAVCGLTTAEIAAAHLVGEATWRSD